MPADGPDVCVIGAGAIGLATAYFLDEKGANVTVLEAEHVASGSSGLSVGIIETQYLTPLDIALRVHAMDFFNGLEKDHGLEITRNGYLRLARNEESVANAERSVAIQHELGVDDATVLDRKQIEEMVPDMNCEDVAAGLFGPSDGFIDGHLYSTLLADLVMAAGVDLKVRQRVTGISSEGERRTVHTESGLEVPCDYVVLAAGAWGTKLAAEFGVSMPLEPQRHQAIVVDVGRSPGYVMPSVMDYIPHSGEIGLYFRHERDGHLIAGLHSEEVSEDGLVDPDNYGRGVDHDFMELVAQKLSVRLPGFPDAGLGGGWAGIYPVSPDGVPQAGPSREDPQVLIAGGAGGSGIQLSPSLGRIVAEWAVDGSASAIKDADQLLPDRPALQGVG